VDEVLEVAAGGDAFDAEEFFQGTGAQGVAGVFLEVAQEVVGGMVG